MSDDNATAPVADVAPEAMTIDQSMDAAFDAIMAREDESAATTETPTEAAPEEQVEAPDEVEAASEELTDQPEEEAVEPEEATPSLDAPNSWSAEMKGKWAELSPDVQDYITGREKQAHDQISRMGQELSTYKPVAQVFEANAQTFQRHNMAPIEGVERLLDVQNQLDNDPVGTLQRIAGAYNVDLSQLANGTAPDQGQAVPQVAALQRQVQDLQGKLAGFEQQQQTRDERDHEALVSQARQDLEASGITQKPHYEELKADIAEFIRMGKASTYAEAYDMAAWASPTARDTLMKAQKDKELAERAKAAEAAKKAAKANIGSKSKPVAQKPMTWEQTMESVADAAYST